MVRSSGLRVALLCIDPWRLTESDDNRPFNYAVRRIQAAILGHPDLHAVELTLIESTSLDIDAICARIEAFNPDIIGASAYVWSFPTLLDVCRQARRVRPDRTVIFGGPSARPELFELPQHSDGADVVDAIVIGEGEACIQEILLAPDRRRETLLKIPGLAVHVRGAWKLTGTRDLGPPDQHPSPYQLGLMPGGVTCQFESFRGCPLSCTYCEWGDTGVKSRNFGYEYLVRELEAIKRLDCTNKGAWLMDAGLNLNSRAFNNLRRAEAEVGALKALGDFRCEVYPSHLNDEHLAFLESVGARYAGIGLQSFDPEVLKSVERPFNEERFNRVVREIAAIVPDTTVEVILGLPGDNPDNFKRTLEKVRKLPVGIRVFHCLVLPSALMTRAPASFELKYDPFTLQVISCRGWSREDFEQTRIWLDDVAHSEDGDIPHAGTWKFRRPGADRTQARRIADGTPIHSTDDRSVHALAETSAPSTGTNNRYNVAAPREMHVTLARCIEKVADVWKLQRVTALDGDMRTGVALFLEGVPGIHCVCVTRAQPGVPSFRTVRDLSYAYSAEEGDARPDRTALQTFDRVITAIHPILHAVILGMRVGARQDRTSLPVVEATVVSVAPRDRAS